MNWGLEPVVEAVVAQQGSPPPGSPPKSAIKRRRSNEPSTILGLSSKRQTTSSRRKSRRSLRPAPSFQIIDSNVAFDCVLIPPTSFKGKIKTRRTILRTSETPQPSVKETNEDYQEGEEFNVVYQEDEVDGEALELDEREEELSRGRSFRGKFKTYKSRRSHSQRSSSVSSSVV